MLSKLVKCRALGASTGHVDKWGKFDRASE
jgi:hypothetical protein